MKTVSMLLVFALSALAQSQPRMYRLYHVDVPGDSAAEFYAVQRETAAVYKNNKASIPRWAWSSITGEPTFHYMVPLAGLDQLGERTWLSQQGDETSRTARTTRLRNSSGAMSTQIMVAQDDVTWNPNPQAAPDGYMAVSIFSVKAGKVSEFLAMIKQVNETVKKMGKAKNIFVSRVAYGGDGYEFHVATGYASLADIPPQAAFRAAMGDGYNAYVQKLGATVNGLRREIVRYRPEFSHIPGN